MVCRQKLLGILYHQIRSRNEDSEPTILHPEVVLQTIFYSEFSSAAWAIAKKFFFLNGFDQVLIVK